MGEREYDKRASKKFVSSDVGDYMKILTRLFTKNLTKIPLLWITFNWKLFKENGAKGSCMCNIHPCLKDDEHIKTTIQELCDYIRENYDMEKII